MACPVLTLGYLRRQIRITRSQGQFVLLKFWAKRVVAWVGHCADAYARAALYENLSQPLRH